MTRLFWCLCWVCCRVVGSIWETPQASWWLRRMFDCEERAGRARTDWVALIVLALVLVCR